MKSLRGLLLLAAEQDILIESRWIKGEDNTLADALSRFKYNVIANICPHWQNLSDLSLPRPSVYLPAHPPSPTQNYYGAALPLIQEKATTLQ